MTDTPKTRNRANQWPPNMTMKGWLKWQQNRWKSHDLPPPNHKGNKVKSFGHRRPVRDEEGKIVGHKDSPVRAVTTVPLDGCFGPDRGRRLIVTCKDKELITIRPFGTRRESTATATDIRQITYQPDPYEFESYQDALQRLAITP